MPRMYFSDDHCKDCDVILGANINGDLGSPERVHCLRHGRCSACQQKADDRNRRARKRRAAIKDVMDSVGMKRVRGNLGGTYYE